MSSTSTALQAARTTKSPLQIGMLNMCYVYDENSNSISTCMCNVAISSFDRKRHRDGENSNEDSYMYPSNIMFLLLVDHTTLTRMV